jgi:hypothetical protein
VLLIGAFGTGHGLSLLIACKALASAAKMLQVFQVKIKMLRSEKSFFFVP